MLPRTNFHSSQLTRCLADLSMVDRVDCGDAFAEQLSQWVHFADAITLSAVHNDGMANVQKIQRESYSDEQAAAVVEFERIQKLLANSIVQSFSLKPGKSHIKLPALEFDQPMNLVTAYTPYRRFYESHQHDMEMRIEPLRANVREAAAKASPKLSKLAELDATFEKILRGRERQLLAKIPLLLKKRFELLFKEHQQKLTDAQQADNPAHWMQAGGWLARFCNDMQMLLLAELDLRLQPVLGLIETSK
jgi:hypothetical protein